MNQTKVSIQMPTQASILRRLNGLREIERRVVASRPEPFYGIFKPGHYKTVKGSLVWTPGKQLKPPMSQTPAGKKWMEMRSAIDQLVTESEGLLTLTRSFARVNRTKKGAPNANK
jgi:hypothetical protein